jgi:hydroxyacylglutathione hydrolase
MSETNYEVIKIDEGSWRIEDGVVRAFLFTGTQRALLVDTGFGTGNLKQVVENLTDKPVMLVNTHADDDHTGCNALFEAAYMHPSDMAFYFEKAPADAVVNPLWDGDVIDLGARSFEVILIPGHTPGSIALLDRENAVLVSGDSVSATPVFMFGSVRNIHAYIASMKKLRSLTDRFDTIYPSHGPFPMGTDMLDELIEGAARVVGGEVAPQEPPFEMPAKMYVSGRAVFLWQKP